MVQPLTDTRVAVPRLAAILGPTASGKTALAVALRAAGLPLEAIGCDALQLYRGLDAATAKPSAAEMAAVPHHLVDVIEPTEGIDAARYADLADEAIADITARGAWPLLVGGTGLYFRAVVRGLAAIPPVPAAVRDELAERWREEGPAALHQRLAEVDPDYAAITPAANRQRVLRALEVHTATGEPFSSFHRAHREAPDRYRTVAIVLDPPADAYRDRLERRARSMIAPLLAEARRLAAAGIGPEHHATQALGYREALAMIARADLDEGALAEALIRGHKRYAKRQRTFFRKIAGAVVLDAADPTVDAPLQRAIDALRAFFEPA